jgi:hypothetical protein
MKKLITSLFVLLVLTPATWANTRDQELKKAINQVGDTCNRVLGSMVTNETNQSITFSVSCSGGYSYSVKVNRDGSAKVLSCDIMKKINSPCFIKF